MLELDIDRRSSTAPYVQVADELIRRVRAGEYEPGDRLPSAQDIVQAAGIAEMTARKALRILLDRGYAELTMGLGYFVPATLPAE